LVRRRSRIPKTALFPLGKRVRKSLVALHLHGVEKCLELVFGVLA
jgi:hypothetical protein